MSDIVEAIGSLPGRRSLESKQADSKSREKAPEVGITGHAEPYQGPPAIKPDATVGLNQSAASYLIHLDPKTMRTITEVIDRVTGDVRFSIPAGYRGGQSIAGASQQSTGGKRS